MIEWEERLPIEPIYRKEKKNWLQRQRTNNPITESKTEVSTHISTGRIACLSQNWAFLQVMNLMSAFTLQILLILKHGF